MCKRLIYPTFNIVEGPNQSTGMSITNGNMSQYKGIIFLLQPKKTGTSDHKASYCHGGWTNNAFQYAPDHRA